MTIRKIDIMMKIAELKNMNDRLTGLYIKEVFHRTHGGMLHELRFNFGEVKVPRYSDKKINQALAHIGKHIHNGRLANNVVPGGDADPADGAAFVAWGFGLLSAIVLTFIWVMN